MKRIFLIGVIVGILSGCSSESTTKDKKQEIQVNTPTVTIENQYELDLSVKDDPVESIISQFGMEPYFAQEEENNVYSINLVSESDSVEKRVIYKKYINFNTNEYVFPNTINDEQWGIFIYNWSEGTLNIGDCQFSYKNGAEDLSKCYGLEETKLRWTFEQDIERLLSDIQPSLTKQQLSCLNKSESCNYEEVFSFDNIFQMGPLISEYMEKNYKLDDSISSEKYIKILLDTMTGDPNIH